MLQALATLFFAAVALTAFSAIAGLLVMDWASVAKALGFAGRGVPALHPYRVRNTTVRRAAMVRVKVPARRSVAA